MSPGSGTGSTRVHAVGIDADVSVVLHLHLERAGYALYCVPSPQELDASLRTVAPQIIVLLLPATPDASWGSALTATASAARVGVRVVVVAPSREVVEPLAAVAGAERALARSEVLARPLIEFYPGQRLGKSEPTRCSRSARLTNEPMKSSRGR